MTGFPASYNQRIDYITSREMEMFRAGINVNEISKITEMRSNHHAPDWVTVYVYHADYHNRLLGTESLRINLPYKEELRRAIDACEKRFGCPVVISHGRR